MKDYIIIGAGQSGLAIAYYLKKQGVSFLLVDANSEIGAPWLKRWDSLKLFTPSEFNSLPGLKFPHKKGHYSDKYEVAAYLKSYVSAFDIPIEFNHKIMSLKKSQGIFTLKSALRTFETKNVIVATGPFHKPFIPPCHLKIAKEVIQIHSEHYKNPSQLQQGAALVVGAGDSGVQILNEISKTNTAVYFSGNTNIVSLPQEILGKTLWWWFAKVGFLTANKYSWIGKKLSNSAQPVIGTDVKALFKRKNVVCVGRTLDADTQSITFEKQKVADIKNIVWATGFKPNFSWIDAIELDDRGYPKNYRGVSDTIEGLYFLGLPWLYTRGSATLGGVRKDAKYLKKHFSRKIKNNQQRQEV
ncbi:potassium transporter (Trk family) protein [Polaribacter irgensii 23-P]|uniref:Potassium transporter (Trk family) protein n=1 Tax=Polaribacter irgensii 23-P TaxID=313594 RepID=A4BX80_9FLAO|nr:NAD(P)/FAD-dependent oxidoreductase [Polaribacter irgensii]EAR13571.1 potassium transporter (Trk family) protein [Polaribacter irgensii 23-P]